MMGKMQRAVIRYSVTDVIRILENEPVQPDMVTELTVAQLMNRVSMAHLSIERAMKFLITEAGGTFAWNHDLPSRLKELRPHDPESTRFLEKAFEDAVRHYRYDTNASHMEHLKSLGDYLKATASDKHFKQDIRYWELGQSKDKILIRKISLHLHLELLHALRELLLPSKEPKDTVSVRVEKTVQDAMFPTDEMSYIPDTDKETSVKSYIEWLEGFGGFGDAIEKAFREGVTDGDDFMLDILSKAYQELANSTDPAVRYLAETLTVLPEQPKDVIPCVEWWGPEKCQACGVSTPGGYDLGFILRRPDGLWDIEPSTDGAGVESAIAETHTDALCYLADMLTRTTRVIINGDERNLRIVGEERYLFRKGHYRSADRHRDVTQTQQATYQVEFWDDQHGITDNDSVKLEVPSRKLEGAVDILQGTVTGVAAQTISISGFESIRADGDYPDRTEDNDRDTLSSSHPTQNPGMNI